MNKNKKKVNPAFKAEYNITRRVEADNKAKNFAEYASR